MDWLRSTDSAKHHDPSKTSRRLVLAIIAQAIEDASRPPTPAEIKAKANRLKDPIQALRWLFAPSPVLEWYAAHVDLDVELFRRALIQAAHSYAENSFRPDQRRVFRLRYQWAKRDCLFDAPYDPDIEDRDDDDENDRPA